MLLFSAQNVNFELKNVSKYKFNNAYWLLFQVNSKKQGSYRNPDATCPSSF